MIQFLGVTKQYTPEITAVEDISFEVNDGEFVFLVGPSGSGKTTLIRMLIREEMPSTGKIFFHDDDITTFKRKQVYMLRRKIGVIFQDYKLIPELNAYENVAFAMEVAGRSEAEIKEHVPYLLDIVGLSGRMHFFPRQLSGGEKQRIAIARAISNNPKLLIADEPTGNLDPESAWDIVQILTKINNWGTTVIMSTHGFDIVNTLHKRVIKMEYGKMVRDVMKGTYEELDDFSLKVMNSAASGALEQKKGEKLIVSTDHEIIVPRVDIPEDYKNKEKEDDNSSDNETNDESEQENNKEEISDKDEPIETKKKLKQTSKKKMKTTEKKVKSAKKVLEEKVLEKIEEGDEDDLLVKAKNQKISDLDLTKKEKDILKNQKFKTLADLIGAGVEDLEEVDGLTKTTLKKISKIIEKFIETD